MKCIIAGGREFDNISLFYRKMKEISSEWEISEIVSGHVRGVDTIGEIYAKFFHIPLKIFHANWKEFGLAAGSMRNKEMVNYADSLIAFWDGKSHGMRNIIYMAMNKGIKVKVIRYDKEK